VPTVERPTALAAAYSATKKKSDDLPTVMLQGGNDVFSVLQSDQFRTVLPEVLFRLAIRQSPPPINSTPAPPAC